LEGRLFLMKAGRRPNLSELNGEDERSMNAEKHNARAVILALDALDRSRPCGEARSILSSRFSRIACGDVLTRPPVSS